MLEDTDMIRPIDPTAAYLADKPQIDEAVHRVLDSGWYILGDELKAFEAEFAAYLGVQHAVGVASGTDALELALRAAGIGDSDIVLTVSHTAVATVAAIERAGAIPALVDIDPARYTMDPAALEQAINSHGTAVRAVIPVHLYGHPADMDTIMRIADRHDLIVIEDAAQAHGAQIGATKVGAVGHFAAFSFYPTKNLAALGDGGAVVTNDDALDKKLRAGREYGWYKRYVSDEPGINSRLDELQAAVLRVRLPGLEEQNDRRRAIAKRYDAACLSVGLDRPIVHGDCSHAYHQYVVRTGQRDALRQHLLDHDVATLIHYPVPVHLQPAYANRLPDAGPLHHSEQAAQQVLSLPIHPQLTDSDVDSVINHLTAFFAASTVERRSTAAA